MSQTVIRMFLHIIVVKVWTFILMNFNWNVIPLLCLYVNISLDELFFELAQDYSREEEPPDPGEWVWVDLLWCAIFLIFLEWCSARKYIHWQDYVDPPGIKFPSARDGGLQAKPYEVGVWSCFFVTAHYDIHGLFL